MISNDTKVTVLSDPFVSQLFAGKAAEISRGK